MKECPICKAYCFYDMDVCYGCMHVFAKTKKENPLKEEQEKTGITLPVLALENSASQRDDAKQEPEEMAALKRMSEKEIRAKHRAEPSNIKEEDLLQAEYQIIINLKPTDIVQVKPLA